MYADAAADKDLAEGGMISFRTGGDEIVLCRFKGKVYAVSRRCGHEGAGLNLGTLNGRIIVCPLHFAQFDITNGKALLGPADKSYGKEVPNPRGKTLETKDLKTFAVKVDKGRILVEIAPPKVISLS